MKDTLLALIIAASAAVGGLSAELARVLMAREPKPPVPITDVAPVCYIEEGTTLQEAADIMAENMTSDELLWLFEAVFEQRDDIKLL